MKKQLIFLGPPGSGKGTQAKILANRTKHKHLSTGDLLRVEIDKKTPLGKKVENILKKGLLVDDNTIMELLAANCNPAQDGHIFDGIPRTLIQAQALDEKILKNYKKLIIYFKIDSSLLVDRITCRRVCPDCQKIFNLKFNPPKKEGVCNSCGGKLMHRNDDKEETIKKRLGIFEEQTGPILQYYKKSNNLVEIDASREVSKITDQLEKIV
ncbi:MAG: nucleoside monophosphate kinase [Halobacteriovoraceae bacterium]|nr:nucleoside monophosphate kinase [Halobacteriovoraceae bacterium]